ncbi:helix-turn-helix domain-containing protein [Planomonospora corallina]|uniref:Helix-turn-helix domain-containing protein n=1 Tax=Planomonospora corallina TaxID=1806052 RepID=A0ABV8I298_9ACTN
MENERSVLRAILAMQDELGEPLTVDDLARTAMFSKFHFSRIFQRVTGLSPGRFLSALRIQEAKRLLVTTSSAVTEISHRIGYSSVGTFSTRFTHSVGVSPIKYRQLESAVPWSLIGHRHDIPGISSTRIVGEISSPLERPVFAGLFPGRLLEGRPVRYTVVDGPGPFELTDLPPGDWYLMTQSVEAGREDAFDHPPGGDSSLYVGFSGPISIRPHSATEWVDVRLRPMTPLHPPALLALRELLGT